MTPFVEVTGTPSAPNTSAIAAASAASLSGVDVPWALIVADVAGLAGRRRRAPDCMQAIAPAPPGDGAVMWWASALLAAPRISPRIVAPRASAASHSSRTNTAAPSPSTKPSRSTSNGLLDPDVDSAVMLPKLTTPTRQPADFGATGDDRVAHAPGDQPGRVADGVGRRRAGGGDRLVRALQPVAHRDGRAGRVGHHHRHEERRHAPLALRRAAPRSGPRWIAAHRRRWRRSCRCGPGRRRRPSGVLERLGGRGDAPSARRGRRGAPPSGCRSTASGSQSAISTLLRAGDARPVEAVPERLLARCRRVRRRRSR